MRHALILEGLSERTVMVRRAHGPFFMGAFRDRYLVRALWVELLDFIPFLPSLSLLLVPSFLDYLVRFVLLPLREYYRRCSSPSGLLGERTILNSFQKMLQFGQRRFLENSRQYRVKKISSSRFRLPDQKGNEPALPME